MTEPEVRLPGLLHLLRVSHRGQNKAVSGRALAEMFGVSDTKRVREAVHILRRQGYPICSNHEGYWFPASREDALPAIQHITSLFRPLREAHDGFIRGLDEMFGPPSLFDDIRAAS